MLLNINIKKPDRFRHPSITFGQKESSLIPYTKAKTIYIVKSRK
jgi:hypothetical protein